MSKEQSGETNDTFIMMPKVDFCFKELMVNEEIEHTELLPTHLRKAHKEDKLGILDVRVRVKGRGQMDMEIQVAPFEFWPERSLFYLGKMFIEQIPAGGAYDTL